MSSSVNIIEQTPILGYNASATKNKIYAHTI